MSTNEAYDPNADGTYTEEGGRSGPYLPPAGHYDARATSWTWEKSKNSGDTYLALIFTFSAPDENGNDRTWTCRGALSRLESLDAEAGATARATYEKTDAKSGPLSVLLNRINAGVATREAARASASDTHDTTDTANS